MATRVINEPLVGDSESVLLPTREIFWVDDFVFAGEVSPRLRSSSKTGPSKFPPIDFFSFKVRVVVMDESDGGRGESKHLDYISQPKKKKLQWFPVVLALPGILHAIDSDI